MKKFLVIIWTFWVVVSLMGCNTRSDERICSGELYLLDETSYPEGAKVTEFVSPLPDSSRYSAGNTIDLGDGIAVQDVHPFSTSNRALKEFEHEMQSPIFSSQKANWQTPIIFDGMMLNADHFTISCGAEYNIPMCRYIAQYKNNFVLLNIQMYPDEMNYEALKVVLLDIDRKMSICTNDL